MNILLIILLPCLETRTMLEVIKVSRTIHQLPDLSLGHQAQARGMSFSTQRPRCSPGQAGLRGDSLVPSCGAALAQPQGTVAALVCPNHRVRTHPAPHKTAGKSIPIDIF